jgi:GT2 family glycosyltransferase
MSSPRVTVILVSYRSRATIDAALEELRPAHEHGALDCIVVDNKSDDGTAEHVRARHSWASLIEAGGNLGFGRGCNLGLARARSDYVLLLNPDAVLGESELARLVAFLDAHPRAAIVGPAIRNSDGTLQRTLPFPTPGRIARGRYGEREMQPIEPGSAPRRADWVCGAVLLARRDVLQRLGGFDPRFFLYFEETDLCFRAHALGWETWCTGEVVARHRTHSSASATARPLYHGCIAEHYFASRFYYLCKHHGRLRAAAAEMADVLATLLRASLRWLRRRPLRELGVRLHAPMLRGPAR